MFFFVVVVVLSVGFVCSDDASDSNSGSYGYSGSFSGEGAPPGNLIFPDFSQFQANFKSFQDALMNNGGGSFSQSSILGNAKAEASSSIASGSLGLQNLESRSGAGGQGGTGGSWSGSFGDGQGFGFGHSFSGGPDGHGSGGGSAFASGSVGPGGFQQRAGVFPENPNNPNVNVRRTGGSGPNGFKSVSTSSHSSSVNGKSFHEAETTINDNGKVSTYKVKNP